MKKFIRTIRNLSERAAEIQEALQRVPPRVAEIREAVTLTTSQLQQLQADVARNVTDLKADGQGRLIGAVDEINGAIEVFQEVGYELGAVEMELSPVPRLMVHLNRVDEVSDPLLRSVVSANRERKITHALLNSIQQAEAMADQVDIQGQVYYKMIVHIGPVPSVRLCWMPEADDTAKTGIGSIPVPASASASPGLSAYGQGSFFGKPSGPKPAQAPAAEAPEKQDKEAPAESAQPEASPVPSAAPTPASRQTRSYRSGGKDWGAASLERFKKMPSESKYRR